MNMDLPTAVQAFDDLRWFTNKGVWPDKTYPTWTKKIRNKYHIGRVFTVNGSSTIVNIAWPLIADVFRHNLLQVMHELDNVIGYAESECESLYSMDDDPEIKEEAEKAQEAVSDANDLLKRMWKAVR